MARPNMMRAMVMEAPGKPLRMREAPVPRPGPGEVLVQVEACGVCRTDLHIVDGELPEARLPLIPGHEIVGRVAEAGQGVTQFRAGERVGAPWLGWTCGTCRYCLSGRENLCAGFRATGRDAHGGYAEYMTAPEDFAFPIPEVFTDAEAAPLLCAGAIGYRSLKLTGLEAGQNLGLTGFGASAHLVLMMVRRQHPTIRVFVFARSEQERAFARDLGAVWAGSADEEPPEKLHAIIDTTPAWGPVVEAMKRLTPGGRLVINAIRKEEADKEALLSLDYPSHLWLEKEIKSVANVTRADIAAFLDLAARIPIKPEVETYRLEEANQALADLKDRKICGAKVLVVDPDAR